MVMPDHPIRGFRKAGCPVRGIDVGSGSRMRHAHRLRSNTGEIGKAVLVEGDAGVGVLLAGEILVAQTLTRRDGRVGARPRWHRLSGAFSGPACLGGIDWRAVRRKAEAAAVSIAVLAVGSLAAAGLAGGDTRLAGVEALGIGLGGRRKARQRALLGVG